MSDLPLPYSQQLISGFKKPIQIVGTPNENAVRFEVNLLDQSGEYLLHYNVRFNENCVVRNCTTSGQQWQREERDGGMPFHAANKFTLDLVPSEDGGKIQCVVNGVEQCLYRGHGGFHDAASLNINGDLQLHNVVLPSEDSSPATDDRSVPQRRDAGEDPSGDGGMINLDENPDEPQPNIVRPPPPEPTPNSGDSQPGQQMPDLPPVSHPSDPGQLSMPFHTPLQDFARTRRLRVVGTPNHDAKQFEVIMRLGNGDALFHFNARLDQNCVFRNATSNMIWQPQWEDKSGDGCPFQPGQQFILDLIANGDVITCFVNGPAYCTYKVHGDINQVHTLQVNGDVQLSQVLIA